MGSLRAYLAWVLFVFGTVNVASLTVRASGPRSVPPTLLEAIADPTPGSIGGAVFSFILIAFFGLTFYFWWKWK
jgi:hypothetical protein